MVRSGEKLARKDSIGCSVVTVHFHSNPSSSINNILNIISSKHCHAHFCLSCSYAICISCDLRFLRPKTFCSVTSTPTLQHRNSSPDCCQSSCARVPSESRAHFNIYWNVIKTTQSDSWQSMLFRLCAAEAGPPTLATVVCLHAIHPHLSEERMVESHLPNSCPQGMVQLRLHADWLQCALIDRACILHMREKRRNMVRVREHYVAQKACPAGFLHISNLAISCQYHQFPPMLVRISSLPKEDPLANWMITVPVLKHTTYWQIPTNCYRR